MNRRLPAWRRAWQRAAPWMRRFGVVVLVLGLYLGAWGPARPYLTRHVAYPLLAAASVPGSPGGAVRLAGGGSAVRVQPLASGEAVSFRTPAGIRFLLPGLFLAAAFPRRAYWVALWGLHVAAGAAALGLLAATVRWGTGMGAYQFWTTAGRDLFSLLVPLWMWLRARQGRFLPPEEAPAS